MTKTTSSPRPPKPKAPAFLAELLAARSPSGYETKLVKLLEKESLNTQTVSRLMLWAVVMLP